MAELVSRDPPALRRFVDAAHGRGLKVVLYASTELSNQSPLYDTYADEWYRMPRSYPFRSGDETAHGVCNKSSWQDWFFWSLGRLMDEHHVDGFFLDGGPGNPCANGRHGCGEAGAGGKRLPTADPWAAREFMLRTYRLIHARKPDGVFDLHKSTVWSPLSCAFTDSGVDGEQLMPLRAGDKPLLDALPPAVFRAQLTGRQFGLPIDFLAYVGAPFQPEQAMGYAMVHGVSWRPWTTWAELEVAGRYWQALDRLEVREEQFHGYWEPALPLAVEPDAVLTSLYRQHGRAVVVTMSVADGPTTVGIRLDRDGLGFTPASATDALTAERLDVAAGRLELVARPWCPRLIVLE